MGGGDGSDFGRAGEGGVVVEADDRGEFTAQRHPRRVLGRDLYG